MDNQEYGKVAKGIRNYKIARMNVLALLAFTLLNMILALTVDFGDPDASAPYLLFSIYTCCQFVLGGKFMQYENTNGVGNIVFVVMLVLAIVILGLCLLFWLLSKKRYWAMIVLTVLVGLDCVMVLYDAVAGGAYASYLIDIVFHGWIMYYFVLGLKAGAQLRKSFPQGVLLTLEELNETYRKENGLDPVTGQPISQPQQSAAPTPVSYDPMTGEPIYAENATETVEPVEVPKKPDSPVLREETGKRSGILKAEYKGMKVSVKMAPFTYKTRIVVDGKVYAEQKVRLMSTTTISAVVNGAEFTFVYSANGMSVEYTLYADGLIIASR